MLINLNVKDNTHLLQKHAKILAGAQVGIHAATEDALDFIKTTVVDEQRYVGHRFYPDVSQKTKEWKAKHGMEKVGRRTGNWITSFDASYSDGGMVGIVSGGGHVKGSDYAKFQQIWDVEKLWAEERGDHARNLIRLHITGALK